MLAWRLTHDVSLGAWWLPSGGQDRDPLAFLLSSGLALVAAAYLVAALRGASVRLRAGLLGLGAFLAVVVPTAGFVALGALTDRPLGQDGGVVQLPLALEKIAAGESPYGADYSDSILGKQSRVSDFWQPLGGNPILRHHAYLPGTHLLYFGPWMLARAVTADADAARRLFDARYVNLLFWMAAAWLASRLVTDPALRLTAAACVLVNPLLWWHQVFGANDILVAAMILLAVELGRRPRPWAAAAVLGLACGTKQLAWPYAPFLLAWLSGASSWRGLASRRLLALAAVTVGVAVVVIVPLAALDFPAFYGDVIVYNVGLKAGDAYPLGGTPGFGFANFLLYSGRVASLTDLVSFAPAYLLLVPLGLLLLRWQMRNGGPGPVLAAGSAALLLSLYVSRVVHPNYLVLAAALLPIGLLVGCGRSADVGVVPLLLLGWAVELVQAQPLRLVWEDALAVRLPAHLTGPAAALAPRGGTHLTHDPLGILFGALGAGLAAVYLTAGLLGASRRIRFALVVLAAALTVAAPSVVAARIGAATGTVRAQDRWAASLATAPVREMFASSYRRDPPAVLEPAGVLRWPHVDPRYLALAAVLAVLLLTSGDPLGAGAALLSTAGAGSVVYGSGLMVGLALALVFWNQTED